jgi:hypothetical protein
MNNDKQLWGADADARMAKLNDEGLTRPLSRSGLRSLFRKTT